MNFSSAVNQIGGKIQPFTVYRDDVGTERVPSSDDAETYDMAMGLVASTGVPVVEVSDADAIAMMPGNKKTPIAGQPNRANEKLTSGSVLAAHVGGSSSNANDSRNHDAKLINDTQGAKNKINKYVNGDFEQYDKDEQKIIEINKIPQGNCSRGIPFRSIPQAERQRSNAERSPCGIR